MPEHGEGSKLEKVVLQSSSEKVTNRAVICPVGQGWCPSHSLSRWLSQGGLKVPKTRVSVSNLLESSLPPAPCVALPGPSLLQDTCLFLFSCLPA